jgi:queuine tRNA-ribosyltransferase
MTPAAAASGIAFELLGADGSARRGRLHTGHGTVQTPCFMPVGTRATVKTLGSEDLEALGVEMALANTYHSSCGPASR